MSASFFHRYSGYSCSVSVAPGEAGGEQRRPVMRVWFTDDTVNVQDMRDPDAQPLVFSYDEWSTFVAAVRRGEFRFAGGSLHDLHKVDPPSLDNIEP